MPVRHIKVSNPSAVPSQTSEPRSDPGTSGGTPVSSPMNVANLERGGKLSASGGSEPHNDEKFGNPSLDTVIVPPFGYERLPGKMDMPQTPINEVRHSHGYNPEHISHASEALSGDHMSYMPRRKMEERPTGVVGDEIAEWGQPKLVTGPRQMQNKFLERGDFSCDNGKPGNPKKER